MRKSEANKLQGVANAILTDYVRIYPADARQVGLDITRLTSLCQTRGLGVFLLDLPSMGKHFDRCLAEGLYVPSRGPLSSMAGKGPLPRLFGGMLARVFDSRSGCLRFDIDVTVVAYLRQIYYFAKGYEHECTKVRTVDTVRDFYDIERCIRRPSLSWEGDKLDLDRARSLRFSDASAKEEPASLFTETGSEGAHCRNDSLDRLQLVCDIVAGRFGLFEPRGFRPRHGRGAVSDAKGDVSKYTFPNWPEKLEGVFPQSEFSFLNYDYWVDDLHTPTRLPHEPPSKLISVPKTAKAPRLIASEPIAHQWCQQVVLRFLERGIRHGSLRNSISLTNQGLSRDLALQASIDGSYATIDLSSASDRLSCWTVERFFRANKSLLEALHSVRTRWIRNTITRESDDTPKFHKLRKFTTMGSAVTFPVQSIIFATVAIAAILIKDGTKVSERSIGRAAKRVRVFGDDIIVETGYYGDVVALLEYLGLKVNPEKSFWTGRFRESCGMDAFMGYDVTPARINSVVDDARPTSIVSAVDSSNNFHRKGLWCTAAFIQSTLPPHILKAMKVVPVGSGSFGLESFCGGKLNHLKSRWNRDLHRMDVRTVTVKVPQSTYPQSGDLDLFQYFTEEPGPEILSWEPGRGRVGKAVVAFTWEAAPFIL